MLAPQLAFDAVALGAAYALVALGFVLVLNATGAVNFAHGDLVTVGGYGGLVLFAWWPQPGIVLLPILLAAMAGLGVLVAAVAWYPLRRRRPETVFVSTIAVGVMMQNALNLAFGPQPLAAPALLGDGRLALGGVTMPVQSLATIAVAAALAVGLHGLFAHTQFGRRMRAAAQDAEMAAALGIDVERMVAASFALGVALAGGAGLLLARGFFVGPTDGSNYMLKAYVAATLGGWGSLPGAVAGALLIAAFEVVYPALPALVPGLAHSPLFSQQSGAFVLDALILGVLAVRPNGLLGRAGARA